jgi:hypothetical protein
MEVRRQFRLPFEWSSCHVAGILPIISGRRREGNARAHFDRWDDTPPPGVVHIPIPVSLMSKAEPLLTRLNRKQEGWANSFCLGQVDKAYQALVRHTCQRLRRWMRAKQQSRTLGENRQGN